MNKIIIYAASFQNSGIHLARIGIVLVLLWIGGLKAFRYEAVGIVPFVANSPTMNFFLKYDAPEYKKHMNKEGEYNRKILHGTGKTTPYLFSYGLGAFIVLIGMLIALYPVSPHYRLWVVSLRLSCHW